MGSILCYCWISRAFLVPLRPPFSVVFLQTPGGTLISVFADGFREVRWREQQLRRAEERRQERREAVK